MFLDSSSQACGVQSYPFLHLNQAPVARTLRQRKLICRRCLDDTFSPHSHVSWRTKNLNQYWPMQAVPQNQNVELVEHSWQLSCLVGAEVSTWTMPLEASGYKLVPASFLTVLINQVTEDLIDFVTFFDGVRIRACCFCSEATIRQGAEVSFGGFAQTP